MDTSATSTVSQPAGHNKYKVVVRPKDATHTWALTATSREDHAQALYGLAFAPRALTSTPGSETRHAFATCGGNRVTVYETAWHSPLTPLRCFADADAGEVFYTCAWQVDDRGHQLLAVAGKRGIIKVFDLSVPAGSASACFATVAGHGNEVNHVTWHPRRWQLLLSASKDESVRLWNAASQTLVAIFGGRGGHRYDVLSVDFHPSGVCFVSGGFDNYIKVWACDTPQLAAAIDLSIDFDKASATRAFPTVSVHHPVYHTRLLHSDYVDSVHWVGDLLFSKCAGVDIAHKVVLWAPDLPRTASTDAMAATVLQEYNVHNCALWFVKAGVDRSGTYAALGTDDGHVHVWNIAGDAEDATSVTTTSSVIDVSAVNPDADPEVTNAQLEALLQQDANAATVPMASTHVHDPTVPLVMETQLLSHTDCASQVRICAFSPDGRTLVFVCDDASVWRYEHVTLSDATALLASGAAAALATAAVAPPTSSADASIEAAAAAATAESMQE